MTDNEKALEALKRVQMMCSGYNDVAYAVIFPDLDIIRAALTEADERDRALKLAGKTNVALLGEVTRLTAGVDDLKRWLATANETMEELAKYRSEGINTTYHMGVYDGLSIAAMLLEQKLPQPPKDKQDD